MDIEKLHTLLDDNNGKVTWTGVCHSCGSDTIVTATSKADGIHIEGGAVYDNEYVKCDKCFKKDKALTDYQPCDVYARVVGYLQPIRQWNVGKRAEFEDRKMFSPEESLKVLK